MKNDLLWDNDYFTVKKINVNERQQKINTSNKSIIATVIEGKLNVENQSLYLGESFIILSDTIIIDIFGEGIILITEVK